MTKHLQIAALAAVAILALGCQKNNVEAPAGVDEFGNEISAEEIFWSVVGQLVDRTQRTADYKGKTFQPTIGVASDGDESVRIVYVNDLGAAVERFNTLVGADITETTPSYTYTNKEVGSLTWTLTNDGASWGTVDVSIREVPTLQKIIYRSPGQDDANGGVRNGGSAYYRFGDVIQRFNKQDALEYWVCVRPSFDPEGKGDSHWISVSPLPKENIWPYYDPEYNYGPFIASNKMEYGMPYNLGDDLEWHQDLAEMLFAIMYPEEWRTNLQNNYSTTLGFKSGLRMFNDFDFRENGHLHNFYFWTNVQKKWKELDIVRKLFGVSYDDMAAAIKPDGRGRGLHLLYKGYSWSKTFSNKPTLYQVHYSNSTTDGKKKNMHNQVKTSVCKQVVDPNKTAVSAINFPLDVYQRSLAKPYLEEARFFGDNNPRWIVRYATGDELSSSGNYDPQLPIPGFNTRDSEVYRYYRDVYPDKDLMDHPETTGKYTGPGYAGVAYYKWGDVYKDETGAIWFVMNQAGVSPMEEESHFNERSPYSELVSFSTAGMDVASNGSRVTNLPTLDEAIRIFMWLYTIQNQSLGFKTEQSMLENPKFGLYVKNVLEYAQVDPRTLLLYVTSQSGAARSDASLCSIAYDTGVAGRQALLRCIVNTEIDDAIFFFWSKYPQEPSSTELNVRNFSNIPITLQDIADQEMVSKYGQDAYARLALSSIYSFPHDITVPRPIRTQTDPKAQNITNYWYNMDLWNSMDQENTNFTFHKDMWNEPVLVLRYARVKDMGEENYSETTTDGHKLTLVSERSWATSFLTNEKMNYEDWQDFAKLIWIFKDYIYLDGQQHEMLTWQRMNN